VFANLPVGVPFSFSFRKYHKYHHMVIINFRPSNLKFIEFYLHISQYLADEKFDPDVPTYIEAKLFCTTAGKLLWMFLQPLFYSFRPMIVNPLPPTLGEFINLVIQLAFDVIVIHYFGMLLNFRGERN